MERQLYLSFDDALIQLTGKRIIIYGYGKDGSLFYDMAKNKLRIESIIDNGKVGNIVDDIGIKSSLFLEDMDDDIIVVITATSVETEIKEELNDLGYIDGENLFIWDRRHFYTHDENVDSIIKWSKSYFDRIDDKENKILIPYESCHDIHIVLYAYVIDYLCKLYDASAESFIRGGKKEVFPTLREIYSAINVKKIIIPELNNEQKNRAEILCEECWDTINDFSDWREITVYGIRFGTTIVRHYNRVNIPYFDPKDIRLKDYLKECMETIVFWKDYFDNNSVRAVVLWDCGNWEGFIRDIGITMGIPTYTIFYDQTYINTEFNQCSGGYGVKYFKRYWNTLSHEQKEDDIRWAKKELTDRLKGLDDRFPSYKIKETRDTRLIASTGISVLICPHIFEEDSFQFGDHLFDDNYWSWLCHIGEMSKELNNYNWYLKRHPSGSKRDEIIMDQFLSRFPHIIEIPKETSAVQLKDEGLDVALTVNGTIGHEYPLLGIIVINAGRNPHDEYSFNINPRSKSEYDYILSNLEGLKLDINKEEIYAFYAVYSKYYNCGCVDISKDLFDDEELGLTDYYLERRHIYKTGYTWKYEKFLDTFSEIKHKWIKDYIKNMFYRIDNYKWEDYFVRSFIE